MILYLNGSPRLSKSNSNTFLNDIAANNIHYLYNEAIEDIFKDITDIDTIVLSFPLYADSPPSKVIELMEYIENNEIDITNKNIYSIINCGFLESKQNNVAKEIINNFCINNSAKYKGSFLIGAGEIIGKRNRNFLFKLISIFYSFKINKFSKCIKDSKVINISTSLHPMNKYLYMLLVNKSFKNTMKRNSCI